MKLKQTRIEPTLLKVLEDERADGFSILELRAFYAERIGFGQFQSVAELRKWLYRRMQHLVNKELFIKSKGASNQSARYFRTDKFVEMFGLTMQTKQAHVASTVQQTKKSIMTDAQARLCQYQVDMHAYAGECLEYQQLIIEYPQLRSDIEQMHRNAKQRSSELLGQIRAITNILQQTTVS